MEISETIVDFCRNVRIKEYIKRIHEKNWETWEAWQIFETIVSMIFLDVRIYFLIFEMEKNMEISETWRIFETIVDNVNDFLQM